MSNGWKPIASAPDDVWPIALCGTMLCCEKGARIVVTGARHGGEWVADCDHQVEWTHWMELPRPPPH